MHKLLYLSSPYSHSNSDIQNQRFQKICEVASKLMNAGNMIISPIAHCHPIAIAGDLPKDYKYWKKYNHRLIDACDEVIVCMMDGWKESSGVTGERDYAKETNKPIIYIHPENPYEPLSEEEEVINGISQSYSTYT